MSNQNDSVDVCYGKPQSLANQTPEQNTPVVQGDFNAKVGKDVQED